MAARQAHPLGLRLDALEACSALAQLQHHLLKQGKVESALTQKEAAWYHRSAVSLTELDSRARRSSRDRKLWRRSRSIATNVPACSRPTGYASPEVGGVSRALAPGGATGFSQHGCPSCGCSPAHALCRSSRSNSLDILRTLLLPEGCRANVSSTDDGESGSAPSDSPQAAGPMATSIEPCGGVHEASAILTTQVSSSKRVKKRTSRGWRGGGRTYVGRGPLLSVTLEQRRIADFLERYLFLPPLVAATRPRSRRRRRRRREIDRGRRRGASAALGTPRSSSRARHEPTS